MSCFVFRCPKALFSLAFYIEEWVHGSLSQKNVCLESSDGAIISAELKNFSLLMSISKRNQIWATPQVILHWTQIFICVGKGESKPSHEDKHLIQEIWRRTRPWRIKKMEFNCCRKMPACSYSNVLNCKYRDIRAYHSNISTEWGTVKQTT